MQWNRHRPGIARLLGVLLLSSLMPVAHALNPGKNFQDYASDTWSLEEGLPQITVLAITQDHTGYMWFGTQAGVARFDGSVFKEFLPDNWAQVLKVGNDNTIWIGTNKGFAYYRDHEMHILGADSSGDAGLTNSPDVRAMLFTGQDRLLAATDQGLLQVDSHGFHRSSLLPDVPLFSLLNWRGSLWAGGVGKLYEITAGRVRTIEMPNHAGEIVTQLAAYDDTLWAGTNNGLYRYVHDQWLRCEGDPAQLHLAINTFRVDSDDNFWVATNEGLARLHRGRMTAFADSRAYQSAAQIESIFEDHEGSLWLGTRAHGVSRLWNGYTRRYSSQQGLRDPLVWSLTPDRHDGIWIGTANGVYRLQHGQFSYVIPGSSLPAPNAYTLLDQNGTLWVGTSSGVLLYRDGHVVTPHALTPLKGLAVEGILQSRDGAVWIATLSGLYRFAGNTLTSFGRKDGLNDIRCRLLFETQAGRLLVGTLSGLYAFEDGRFIQLAVNTALRNAFVTAIDEPRAGELIVGTFDENLLFLFDGKNWQQLSHNQGLPRNTPTYMTLDSSGEWLWVAGIRGIYRTRLANLESLAAGKAKQLVTQRILSERGQWPGSAKGLCCNGAGNARGILEDGHLWLPTRDGVVSVDTHDVHQNQVVPATVIESVKYGGQWHPVFKQFPLQIPARDRDIAFRFSVLSFQNPRSVRMIYRLRGYDKAWRSIEPDALRVASYTNLPPGDYTFEVRGSNNAGVWNPDTTLYEFSIDRFFYETWWFRTGIVLILIWLIYVLYRWRVRALSAQRQYLESVVAERTEALQSLNRQLEEASQTDPLTGLKNRRYLGQQLPKDLAHFRRELNRPENRDQVIVFAVVDLDHFKELNDSTGHFAGDELLKQVANVLVASMRLGHYVVRWGGEEFLIVFRPMPRNETARVVARVHGAVGSTRYTLPNNEKINITCSIGFTEYPFVGDDPDAVGWETLVNLADSALYAAKAAGRNCWLGLRPGPKFNPVSLKDDMLKGLDAMLDDDKLKLVNSL